jgi:hypothetical protein
MRTNFPDCNFYPVIYDGVVTAAEFGALAQTSLNKINCQAFTYISPFAIQNAFTAISILSLTIREKMS